MSYDPNKHHRRSIRLSGYDYSQKGIYFVTVCTQNREHLFGRIENGEMQMNDAGRMVEFTWFDLPNHNPHIVLDEFVVMPDHVHGVILITDGNADVDVGAGSEPAPTEPTPTTERHPLSEIVRQFKTFSAKRVNQIRGITGIPVWQRDYYEHIIRNDAELDHVRQYIANNPAKWDYEHGHAIAGKGGFQTRPNK
jgi:REP element-mobilizing transposase RayT